MTLHDNSDEANFTITEIKKQLEEIITAENVNMAINLAVNFLHLQPTIDILKTTFISFMMDGVTDEGVTSLAGNVTTELSEVAKGFINITQLSGLLMAKIDNFLQFLFGPEAALNYNDEFSLDLLDLVTNVVTAVTNSVIDRIASVANVILRMFLTVDNVSKAVPIVSMAALTLRNPFLLNMLINNTLNKTCNIALSLFADENIDSNVDFITGRLNALIQLQINSETVEAHKDLYMQLQDKFMMLVMTSDNPTINQIVAGLADMLALL